MKVRIWYRVDGGIMTTGRVDPKHYDEIMEKTGIELTKQGNTWVAFDDVDEIEIPSDKTYFAAWTGSKGNGISIDAVMKAQVDNGELPKGGSWTEEEKLRAQKISAGMRKMAEDNLIEKGELEREG